MNEIYKHAENPIFYSKQTSEEALIARKKDDQTNSYLNGLIAMIGVVGFLGSIIFLNGRCTDQEDSYSRGGGLCIAAMANAGIIYNEKKHAVKMVVPKAGKSGVPVTFSVQFDKKSPVRLCFGDGVQQELTDYACFHTYQKPGKYPVKVQQLLNGSWNTVSSEIIEISGIRDTGLLGYSKYH